MRKKCIAIAKKAMVWTLAASMLIATPLTASAAGLRGVYKVEDGWGVDTGAKSDDTRTGTVTSTYSGTDTGVLKSDNKLKAIVLSETNVKMELDGAYDPNNQQVKTLSVSFVWDGDDKDEELEAKLRSRLTWKSGNNNVVALNNKYDGKVPNGVVDTMTLVAKGGGSTTVTVSLDDYENNIHFSTAANVSVTQYSSVLGFSEELEDDAYEGTSLNLNDYLVRDPETANDKVVFELISAENKCATLKNGVLKLNANKSGSVVTVVAIGEHVKSENTPIRIRKAVHATKVEIKKAGTEDKDTIKKYDWSVNTDGTENEFVAVLTSKTEAGTTTTDPDNCTDSVTWSSKKPAVVDVESIDNAKGTEVTLVAKSVGKAQIIAQASGGKKGTLNVTVTATLTGFEISADTDMLYAGQSLQLKSKQYFGENGPADFTDAGLTWSFAGDSTAVKAMKKVASINAKTGVVTAKADVTGLDQIKVTATNSKKAGDTKAKEMPPIDGDVAIRLEQINVTSIAVYNNASVNSKKIAGAALNNGTPKTEKGETVDIAVDTERTYRVVAVAEDKNGKEVDASSFLNWSSSNTKLASATRNGNGSGTVAAIKKGKPTITVSGVTRNKNGKYVAMKATFKANVTVPTKSLVLTTKNSAIAGTTTKTQTITVKATLDKGTTSKTKNIVWTATQNGESVPTTGSGNTIKSGKLKLVKNNYEVGDVFVVTATLTDAGVQSSMTLKVVEPTNKVQFVDSNDGKITSYPCTVDGGSFEVQTQIDLTTAKNTWVTPGEGDRATVTYTLNKSGIVQLVGNRVTPIKKGTVKITATTSDGKKATLTVKVTE